MSSELDALDPGVESLTLTTGFELQVVRMQTRQFFRMLKVLTHGAGPRLVQELDFSQPVEIFTARIIAILAISIPDAENETIDFLRSVTQPAGLAGGTGGKQLSQMSKQETENDQALWARHQQETFNPDPIDTINIIEALIRREGADMQALGKKLMAVLGLAKKTGQLKDEAPETPPEEQGLHSSAASPAPSTSSATSTGGQTSNSSPSRSAGSGRQQRQLESAGAESR